MRRPLHSVLESFEAGCRTVDEIGERTGMSRDMVSAAIDHLRRIGRIEAKELTAGCPSGGCGTCASGRTDGSAGCGASGPSSARQGPVLVQLSLKRQTV